MYIGEKFKGGAIIDIKDIEEMRLMEELEGVMDFKEIEEKLKEIKEVEEIIKNDTEKMNRRRSNRKKANRGLLKAIKLLALWTLLGVIGHALDIYNNKLIAYIWFSGEMIVSGIVCFNLIRWCIAYRYRRHFFYH